MAFAGEADVIEDRTGDPAEQVSHRINGMLEKQGRFLAHVETNNV